MVILGPMRLSSDKPSKVDFLVHPDQQKLSASPGPSFLEALQFLFHFQLAFFGMLFGIELISIYLFLGLNIFNDE